MSRLLKRRKRDVDEMSVVRMRGKKKLDMPDISSVYIFFFALWCSLPLWLLQGK